MTDIPTIDRSKLFQDIVAQAPFVPPPGSSPGALLTHYACLRIDLALAVLAEIDRRNGDGEAGA